MRELSGLGRKIFQTSNLAVSISNNFPKADTGEFLTGDDLRPGPDPP